MSDAFSIFYWRILYKYRVKKFNVNCKNRVLENVLLYYISNTVMVQSFDFDFWLTKILLYVVFSYTKVIIFNIDNIICNIGLD